MIRIGGRAIDPTADIHAGARETSFIAYRHPALLRECVRGLPPVLIDVGSYARQRARWYLHSHFVWHRLSTSFTSNSLS